MKEYKITFTEKFKYRERDNSIHTFEKDNVVFVKGCYNAGFIARAILHELQNDRPDSRWNIKDIEEVEGSN